MKCKYKTYATTAEGKPCKRPKCRFTDGECQFITEVQHCSIAAAFDGFIPENEEQPENPEEQV